MQVRDDVFFMKKAIEQAKKAFECEDVPVGCVIVQNGKVIAKGYNKKEAKHCSVFHAEILALESACKKVGDWRLLDCTLYVTMEPCAMCAGAIVNHRIKRVVIGVTEEHCGACGSGIDILNNENLGTKTEVLKGVLKDDCKDMLQKFFRRRRLDAKIKN